MRVAPARGLTGVRLVTSDAHVGLVAAIGATLPGTSWQRCRTHYAANLMSATPKASWPWVKTLLHSVYDQHHADSVHAQFDRLIEAVTDKLPKVGEHLEDARADVLAFTAFPKELWRQIWSNNPGSGPGPLPPGGAACHGCLRAGPLEGRAPASGHRELGGGDLDSSETRPEVCHQ